MTEKRLYEVINPSDAITFRATIVEAACIAERLRAGMYFVKDVETDEDPKVGDLQAEYNAIWKSADKIASYAEAYKSFMVGSVHERLGVEKAIATMNVDEAKQYLANWHDKRRTSMNDICRQVWEAAERIAATEPEVA